MGYKLRRSLKPMQLSDVAKPDGVGHRRWAHGWPHDPLPPVVVVVKGSLWRSQRTMAAAKIRRADRGELNKAVDEGGAAQAGRP